GATGGPGRGRLAERVRRLEAAEPVGPRRAVRLAAGAFATTAVAAPLLVGAAAIAELAMIC
ncbi:hypothetical protein, partial [Actinomadura formosensis]